MGLSVKREILKEVRINSGFSQRELSRLINVSNSYVSLIESGVRNPSPKNARKICEMLCRPFEDIFFIEV